MAQPPQAPQFPVPTKETFQNVRDVFINDFVDNAVSTEGWEHSKDKDGVTIETKKKVGTDMLCCRGKGKIHAPPEVVFALVTKNGK